MPDTVTRSMTDNPIIQVHDLSVSFGEKTALNRVDLSVERGEVMSLVGRSGSGKSTLLRVLDGLCKPTDGEVQVLGVGLNHANARQLRALRSRVGFVFQQFHLVPVLTALENVCTGALGMLHGPRIGLWMYPRKIRNLALEQLDRVGLADAAFQRADTLSGGQQQRVAIARSLMQKPQILLADEPVASLDPASSHQIIELMKTIVQEDGLTVVCSLHQVDIALSFGRTITGLRNGSIVIRNETARVTRNELDELYIDSTMQFGAEEAETS